MRKIFFLLLILFSFSPALFSMEAEGWVSFEFWPSYDDWQEFGYDMQCSLCYWNNTNSAKLPMYADYDQGYFYISVDVERGWLEFYFEMNGVAVEKMSRYEGEFSPNADRYPDDTLGGDNAWVEVK